MRVTSYRFLLSALSAALVASTAGAQQQTLTVRGAVRDSASGAAVAGAVVVFRDGAGAQVGRAIARDNGQFNVVVPTSARRAQVVRIGFRPREVALSVAPNGAVALDVNMARLATMLEPIVSTASSRCRAGPDAAMTSALLEQARAGLLATVVTREANPAAVTRLVFDRQIEGNGDSVVRQKVRISTDDRATGSFNASRTARDFVQQGFRRDSAERQTFFGPDAEVLLDPGFNAGYCFHVAKADNARPGQAGLTFAPVARRDGRIDIEGTLWIDTVGRALSDIEFRYVGFGNNVMEGFRPGGRASFKEVASGIVLIDRWSLRLVGAADTTVYSNAGKSERTGFAVREVGGELARATWPDGRAWQAPLGALDITAAGHDSKVAPGTVVALDSTDYRATADSTGRVHIADLVPGPYSVVVLDPALTPLGITLSTRLGFVAQRDSTARLALEVPTATDFMTEACRASARGNGNAMLIGRVTSPTGEPIERANWTLSTLANGAWRPIAQGGITGTTGLFLWCRGLDVGQTVQIGVSHAGGPNEVVMRRIADRVTAIPIRLRSTVASATTGPASILRGTVTDSASGTAVAGAHVSLAGTTTQAITDSAGRFALRGVRPGEYTVEIRTWSLDSLDAVSQSTVMFNDSAASVRLNVPTLSQLATALCGPRRDGILVGNVDVLGDSVLPSNVRVVAEWSERVTRNGNTRDQIRWVEARTNARGTYRLCGVPLNTPVVLRAEYDSAGANPRDFRMADASRFGRVEMTLDRALQRGAVFSGFVMVDSTESPVVDAEVALTTLAKKVMTNEEGAFRITDIPPGEQNIDVHKLGLSPMTSRITFSANQIVDRRISLGRTIALAPVITRESPTLASFEEHRKQGLGAFVTSEQLTKQEGRSTGAVLSGVRGLGVMQSGSRAFIIGSRVPPSLIRGQGANGIECGATAKTTCTFTKEDLAQRGYYCPTDAERIQGIICACYAQVYLDGRVMNPGRPTEPFDVNTLPIAQLEGIEWYASAAQTPVEYARLNSNCGVLVLWSRTRAPGGD